jgi:hypothetical protein
MTESHAVEYPMRTGIQLNSILSRDGSDVVAFGSINRDLFIDEVDLGHEGLLMMSYFVRRRRLASRHRRQAVGWV